jgi:sialate O-acetylesterase
MHELSCLRVKRIILLVWILVLKGASGFCDIRLPRLISEGAVLQREVELRIWGWASPGEQVELSFNQQSYHAETDPQGSWEILLPPQKAGGPYTMIFRGNNEIILHNILVGEVWLCSGQSNMELTMERLKDTYPEIIAGCENPQIRQFLVPDRYDFNAEHEDLESGSWKSADPESILEFSGVAYFFAAALYDRYRVPVGLINAALGGSPVEAWMSEDGLVEFPEAFEELQLFKNPGLIRDIEQKDQARQREWYAELQAGDRGLAEGQEWFLPAVNDEDWEEMDVPGFWADHSQGEVQGVVWFRKKVVLPESMAGKEARLWLGRIVDQDHVYVNGKYVGTTGYQYPPRKYPVPSGLLKKGENTIAIRIINEQGRGGFIPDKPYFLDDGTERIDLKGRWKYRLGKAMPPLESPTFIRWKPGGLYKAMIAPLLPYRIQGVIWYQGESNADRPQSYRRTFPALIGDWREHWQTGDFPFLYVQLANFMEETTEPAESNWAALRQAQLETLSVPNTGMAVIIDLGEWNDIHPLNKKEVGERLAQLAFALAYGESGARTSPVPVRQRFTRKNACIWFSHQDLVIQNGQVLNGFEISGDGKHFFKARAEIRGAKVLVWNDQISQPVAVRYAWSDNPHQANLYSGEGLPASPFELRKE